MYKLNKVRFVVIHPLPNTYWRDLSQSQQLVWGSPVKMRCFMSLWITADFIQSCDSVVVVCELLPSVCKSSGAAPVLAWDSLVLTLAKSFELFESQHRGNSSEPAAVSCRCVGCWSCLTTVFSSFYQYLSMWSYRKHTAGHSLTSNKSIGILQKRFKTWWKILR